MGTSKHTACTVMRSHVVWILLAHSATARYTLVVAPVCPLGKLDVGGALSNWSTLGRSLPTIRETVKNTVTCSASDMAGMMANHHWRDLRQMKRTITRHVALRTWVLPIDDTNDVIASHWSVRASTKA